MTWTVNIPVKLDNLKAGTPEVRHLALSPAEVASPVAAVILLGLRLADGHWDPAVTLSPLRLSDDPKYVSPLPVAEEEGVEATEATEPEPRNPKQDATDFINAVLTAKIDGTNPLAARFGIPNGTVLSQALPKIAWGLVTPPLEREDEEASETDAGA